MFDHLVYSRGSNINLRSPKVVVENEMDWLSFLKFLLSVGTVACTCLAFDRVRRVLRRSVLERTWYGCDRAREEIIVSRRGPTQPILIPPDVGSNPAAPTTKPSEILLFHRKNCDSVPRIPTRHRSQKFPFNFNDYQLVSAAPRSKDAAWTRLIANASRRLIASRVSERLPGGSHCRALQLSF